MTANGIPTCLGSAGAQLLATIDGCVALWRRINAERIKAGQPELTLEQLLAYDRGDGIDPGAVLPVESFALLEQALHDNTGKTRERIVALTHGAAGKVN
jgi:hypothetical protein